MKPTWIAVFDLGYRPFTYAPEQRRLCETTWETQPTGNIIAVADLDLAGQRLRSVVLTGNRSD